MIFVKVKNLTGDIVIDSFPIDFRVPEKKFNPKKDKDRYTLRETNYGTLEVIVSGEERIRNSNKVFECFIDTLESSLENTSAYAMNMVDDYLHNIVKIHGDEKIILERCISGAEELESYESFVRATEEKIKGYPAEFAEDICALSKEIRLVDYHIGGYNLLRNSTRITITNNHNLKKFLLGLSHLFFEQFRKNNVIFSLYGVHSNFLCSFEYETFNIAMHSFIENIVKYSKFKETVTVFTKEDTCELIFEMISVRIDKDEISEIFKRGVSGRHVPEYLRGSGIGMYQLKKALDRSNISILIIPDHSQSSEFDDICYTKNTFVFQFPKNQF